MMFSLYIIILYYDHIQMYLCTYMCMYMYSCVGGFLLLCIQPVAMYSGYSCYTVCGVRHNTSCSHRFKQLCSILYMYM